MCVGVLVGVACVGFDDAAIVMVFPVIVFIKVVSVVAAVAMALVGICCCCYGCSCFERWHGYCNIRA